MTRSTGTLLKFSTFAAIMLLLTAGLFLIFSEFRGGSTNTYSAVFTDSSSIKEGDTVRVSGIRVGTVKKIALQPDKTVMIKFDADRKVVLTTATKVAVRYLNLVGDRYLELLDSPGSTQLLPAGSLIPRERTQPALDLDLLLGGLKPVIRGLNPQDVNALTSSLIQIFQGQGGTLESLLSKTSSFSTAIADRHGAVERLIDNLNTVAATLADDGPRFSATIDKLRNLVGGLAADRDPIATAIDKLDTGTASVGDLLTQARPPLKGTVDQLSRLAPLLDNDNELIDTALQKAPNNYRKLVRLGAYGSFINYYICAVQFRASDLQGRTVVFPWIKQDTGRCAEP
ncbi:virulence factor Mce family protein [Mycolicibacterium chubuense NBB4]|uniref:Virulence factor Mce family protein n=1 Tax=Mycolicibacterium chubuense (strain NBB4) TaxID=710421 RepID=I4BG35_MYCCN|nr:MCE family protein [Mycolicibacterium chubuense]AFM16242.1 virulence factor Mce family protein [Mycolicibacterium chubuense NBB4]